MSLASIYKYDEYVVVCGRLVMKAKVISYLSTKPDTTRVSRELISSYRTRLSDLKSLSDEATQKLQQVRSVFASHKIDLNRPIVANFHMKTGGKDGVAIIVKHIENMLEVKNAKMHRVTGLEEDDKVAQTDMSGIIPGLNLTSEINLELSKYLCKKGPDVSLEDELKYNDKLLKEAHQTYIQLMDYYISNPDKVPDAAVIHNFFSLPVNPAGTIALYNFFRDINDVSSMKLMFLHHDYYSKRDHYRNGQPEFDNVRVFSDPLILKDLENSMHMVLNKRDQDFVYEKFGLESTIVYNFDDFSLAEVYDSDAVVAFRAMLKDVHHVPDENDIFIQGTRTVARKQIELAIDVVAQVNSIVSDEADKKYLLMFGKSDEDEDGTGYTQYLKDYADYKGVGNYIKFIGDNLTPAEEDDYDNQKYSFKTIYQASKGYTYFSSEEGFGNNLLEAMRFVVNRDLVSGLSDIVLDLDYSNDSFGRIMEGLDGIYEKMDSTDPYLGMGEDQYRKLLAFVGQTTEKLPALGMIGGKGIGYEVYLDEIKSVGRMELFELGSRQVKRGSLNLGGRTFKNFNFEDLSAAPRIGYFINNPRQKLIRTFSAIHNYRSCMEHFSYEALSHFFVDVTSGMSSTEVNISSETNR